MNYPRYQPGFDYTAQLANGQHRAYPGDYPLRGETPVLFGTSLWNPAKQLQYGVGIDVDTDNHGLDSEKFNAVLEACRRVPCIEIVRSKGGSGIHAWVKFTEPVAVADRKESRLLGEAVCVAVSRIAGFNIKDAKCCAGGNMWVYARNAAPNAFELLKEATAALDPACLPPGWREVSKVGKVDFAPNEVELDAGHLAIEQQIAETGYTIVWQEKHRCWHIHTYGLQLAAKKHNYRGSFTTESRGTNKSKPNGYMFPLPGSAFIVYRFNDAKEPTWHGDSAYLNEAMPIETGLQNFALSNST